MRKATMRDVSEATGFSMFTVSRALNGGDGVADDSPGADFKSGARTRLRT